MILTSNDQRDSLGIVSDWVFCSTRVLGSIRLVRSEYLQTAVHVDIIVRVAQ